MVQAPNRVEREVRHMPARHTAACWYGSNLVGTSRTLQE
jgi:hypothetical protein